MTGCSGGPAGTSGDDAVSNKPAPKIVLPVEGGPITVPIDGTSVELEMVPVNGAPGGGFYVSSTELTWDLYDAFIFNLDTDAGESTPESDAVTRPSKPYVLVDRGYGHAGYAALSISPRAAEQMVEWLSTKTGRPFRIPTETEMSHLLATSGVSSGTMTDFGWFEENSDYTTHEVASLQADANGLHDLWGNVSEYATTSEGDYVVMGGSFIDPVEDVDGSLRIPFTPDWNADDPQIPKSPWWLASNDWVGVRVVCDP
jgi:formylglycine-generating enzyme required for sulfatase activity